MTPSRTRRRSASLGLAALLGITFTLAFAATLSAQALNDPRIAEFDPSPDHWAVLDSGQPAVSRYEFGVYLLGASAPFATVDLGKPSPQYDGKLRYEFASNVAGWPLPGGTYEARVSAIGPGGAAPSAPSNPFTFTIDSTCTIYLSATIAGFEAWGGSDAVNVSTRTGCGWAATTALPWVTLQTAGGSGSGTVPFVVQANSSSFSRTGTITIGGQALTLQQAASMVPTISWTTPATITQGTPLGAMQMNAVASVPGAFAYSPAAGTVLAAGTHTLTATFTPAETTLHTTRYTTATAYMSLTVSPAPYQLTISRPSGGTVQGPGINCGTKGKQCSVTMPAALWLGLQATPDPGYTFTGWTGHCSGAQPGYALALDGPRTCSATFAQVRRRNGG